MTSKTRNISSIFSRAWYGYRKLVGHYKCVIGLLQNTLYGIISYAVGLYQCWAWCGVRSGLL